MDFDQMVSFKHDFSRLPTGFCSIMSVSWWLLVTHSDQELLSSCGLMHEDSRYNIQSGSLSYLLWND